MDLIVFALMLLITVGTVTYTIVGKHLGKIKNPFAIIMNTFFIATVIMLFIIIIEGIPISEVLSIINLPIMLVSLGWYIYNIAFVYAFKNGAKASTLYIMTTSGTSITLIIVGLSFLSETLKPINFLGIVIVMISAFLLSNNKKSKEVQDEK